MSAPNESPLLTDVLSDIVEILADVARVLDDPALLAAFDEQIVPDVWVQPLDREDEGSRWVRILDLLLRAGGDA